MAVPGSEVQSQAAKLEGIEQGVCHVIPDYQNENAKLKDALAKKTAACDFMEGKLVSKTRVIMQQGKYIDRLDDELQLLKEQNRALVSEKDVLLSRTMRMKEQLELSQHLKQTLEKSQHLADILSSTLADERAAKRARTQE
jgi:predicted RNase H-like nuclease (RuvC/YqgF family)